MSTTKVTIVSSHLGVKAEPSEVSIVEGDTIVFLAETGAAIAFTDATAALLSPSPDSVVAIDAGASLSFEFNSPDGGPYCCQVLTEGSGPRPIQCADSSDGEPVLTILASLGGRDIVPQTGRLVPTQS